MTTLNTNPLPTPPAPDHEAMQGALGTAEAMLATDRYRLALRSVAMRYAGVRRFTQLFRGVRGLLVLVLGVVLIDAMSPLSATARCVALALVAVVTASTIWRLLRRGRHQHPSWPLRREAQRLSDWLHRDDDLLVNAVDAEQSQGASLQDTRNADLQHALRERVILLADRALEGKDVRESVATTSLRRQRRGVALATIAWLVVLAIEPRVIGVGLERLALPLADLPAFSFTRFDVEISPKEVQGGENVTVAVTVSGRLPEVASPKTPTSLPAGQEVAFDVELVVQQSRDATSNSFDGAATRTLSMSPITNEGGSGGVSHRFSITLRGLDVRTRIHARTSTGRSRWHVIEPRPAANPGGDSKTAHDQPDTPEKALPIDGDSGISPQQAALRAALARLRELAASTARSTDEAATLRARLNADAEGIPAWLRKRLNDLIRQGHADLRSVGDAAEALNRLAMEMNEARPDLAAELQRLVESLRRLQENTQARPSQRGAGQVGPGTSYREMIDRLDDLAVALRQHRDVLRQAWRQLQEDAGLAAGSDGAATRIGGADQEADPDTPDARGTRAGRVAPGTGDVQATEAWLDQTPPRYRALARQYFDRIARDTKPPE